jgi:DNA-binding transcriptional regulator YhcF (GntR family)
MTTQTKEKQLISVKQLADKAGIKPSTLRRILRAEFPRKDKGKNYRFTSEQAEAILKAVKDSKAEKPKAKSKGETRGK